MIIICIAGQIKMAMYKMSQYFPKPYNHFGGNLMFNQICLIMQQKLI